MEYQHLRPVTEFFSSNKLFEMTDIADRVETCAVSKIFLTEP